MAKAVYTNHEETYADFLVNQVLTKKKLPWLKPWNSDPNACYSYNAATGHEYQGMNMVFLPAGAYITWNQATSLGGKIKDGQSKEYQRVYFYSRYIPKDQQGLPESEQKAVFFFKTFTVYNINQWDNLPAEKLMLKTEEEIKEAVRGIESADKVLLGYKNPPSVSYGGNRAYYSPYSDSIQLPKMEQFKEVSEFYSTKFHEYIHSTGHESRLKRDMGGMFGDQSYSLEELIAEFGACLLCKYAGIDSVHAHDNSIAYLQGWADKLKSDPKILSRAMSAANKAVSHILGN